MTILIAVLGTLAACTTGFFVLLFAALVSASRADDDMEAAARQAREVDALEQIPTLPYDPELLSS